jgi:hypothetical protein
MKSPPNYNPGPLERFFTRVLWGLMWPFNDTIRGYIPQTVGLVLIALIIFVGIPSIEAVLKEYLLPALFNALIWLGLAQRGPL